MPATPMAHISEVGTYEPRFDALNAVTLAEINRSAVPDIFFVSTPMQFVFKEWGPVTCSGGDTFSQSIIYEAWPLNPRICAKIENLG